MTAPISDIFIRPAPDFLPRVKPIMTIYSFKPVNIEVVASVPVVEKTGAITACVKKFPDYLLPLTLT
jgi:hypothetical protein